MSTKAFLTRCILLVSVPLLPLSVGFVVVGITLSMLGNVAIPRFVISVPAILSGLLLMSAGLCLKSRMRFHFAATFLILTGTLLFLIDIRTLNIDLPSIWPILMLFLGISFSVSGYLSSRKLLAVYIAPAIAFAGLGFIFLLFTTHVIRLSFTAVVLWWFPILLVPSVLSFIIWVFRKGRKDQAGDD